MESPASPSSGKPNVAALESHIAYRQLLSEDRLAEASTTITTKEVVASGEVISIRADSTPTTVVFAQFMHRPDAHVLCISQPTLFYFACN